MSSTIVADACEGTHDCVPCCSVECIHHGGGTNAKGAAFMVIDPWVGTNCGVCLAICPVEDAILDLGFSHLEGSIAPDPASAADAEVNGTAVAMFHKPPPENLMLRAGVRNVHATVLGQQQRGESARRRRRGAGFGHRLNERSSISTIPTRRLTQHWVSAQARRSFAVQTPCDV